jgi:TRAP-type C4-dicarboxylate transport system permease small subunit
VKRFSLSGFSSSIALASGRLTALILFLLMILVVVGVFMRYFLNRPLPIVDEFSEYMLAAITFLGLTYTLNTGGHIKLGLVGSHLQQRVFRWLDIATSIISLLYVFWFAWLTYGLVLDSYTLGSTSPSTVRTPLYIPQMVLPVGLILMGIGIIVELLQKAKSSQGLSNEPR